MSDAERCFVLQDGRRLVESGVEARVRQWGIKPVLPFVTDPRYHRHIRAERKTFASEDAKSICPKSSSVCPLPLKRGWASPPTGRGVGVGLGGGTLRRP